MDKVEMENNGAGADDSSQLYRNRSFKSKQLVRSQAIRESQSPPRTASPAVPPSDISASALQLSGPASHVTASEIPALTSSPVSSVHVQGRSLKEDSCDVIVDCINDCDARKGQVEIQITAGACESSDQRSSEQKQRAKQWLVYKNHSDSSRDLLSNNPRVACICGACAACPHCRGRRRRHQCPTKQDSGIVCSDDCPDCSDNEQGTGNDTTRKSASLDVDDQIYCRCPERKERPKNNSFTRTDSDEKSEPTGLELVNFIKETLNKNARDRMTLLKIEKELLSLLNDTGRCIVRFPVMTSYGRMLVHRCAALFQLSHHIEQSNKNSVVVSKSGTSGGRIPCTSFKAWCTATFPPSPQRHHETHAKSILKRDALGGGGEGGNGAALCARSKSLEQREKEYERVRRRIFSTDNCSQDEQWPWNSGPVKLLTPEAGRNKLLKVQSLEGPGCMPRPPWRCRGPVSKSHSFSGYGNTNSVDLQPHPRLLSRQGDLASSSWRLSPSSSGYKTLSLRSTDSITPSPTGGASPEPFVGANQAVGPPVGEGSVVWAVTDMAAVPPGALVIHPQTGRPLTNPDGSIYHFDPANPPVIYDQNSYNHTEQKVDHNVEKRRGRLEKQHSFIDNDCECQLSEECRNKCCCECRRHESCKQKHSMEKETNTIPTSPAKTRYETQAQAQTPNHKPPFEATTNNKQVYETTSNQKQPYESPTNQKQPYEATASQTHENQRQFETPPNQRSSSEYSANQRLDSQRSFEHREQPNQRPVGEVQGRPAKTPSHEGPESQQYRQPYAPQFRPDEVTSPQMNNHLAQQEMVSIQNAMAQAKITPVPMPDPSIRPVSLTNMMYQPPVPQTYPYVNPTRVEQQMAPPMYQPLVQHPSEEQKQLPASPHTNETTFRIDPSYPYAAVDYTAACGACVDPNTIHQQPRSYSVPYGQVEMAGAVIPQTYSMGNVILPQPHMQPYPYQEAVQWPGVAPAVGTTPKVFVHELYPVMQYSAPYPQYNIMYPQVMPQPYPICQPIYPITDKTEHYQRRNSVTNSRPKHNSMPPSARNTPLASTPEEKKAAGDAKSCNEITARIQRMKEQLNDREKEKREEWSRNSGSGILGCYPNGNGRVSGSSANDETQLSSAARAIVNTIRNMQAKSTYHNDARRPEGHHQHHRYENRQEFRPKRYDRDGGGEGTRHPRPEGMPRGVGRGEQFRPPYLFRQMSPGTWCRRSPGPVHPVFNNPRRPHPDSRNYRR